MANYCTVTHFRRRLDLASTSLQVEQLCGTSDATTQDEVLEQFLEEACGLVDAYLVQKYTVPVTTIADNAFLRGISLDIAVYEFFKRGAGDTPPSKYRVNYEDSIRSLEDIAAGAMAVPGGASAIQNTSIDFETDDTVFTEDDLTQYF